MRPASRKITTAAVATALAVAFCATSAYLPLSIMPLYLAAFCIFVAIKRGGVPHGILCAVATVAIMFAMTGLSVKWFFLLFMFAPYGIVAAFTDKFTYFKVKSGILRGLIAAAFFNLTFGLVYLVTTRVATVGLDVPVIEWIEKLGGYIVLAAIGTALFLPLDFIFSSMSIVVLKRLLPGDKVTPPGGSPFETVENGRRYDIFGYEIKDGEEAVEEVKNRPEPGSSGADKDE